MRFVKMHGIGNDYVYINLFPGYEDSVEATYAPDGKLLTVDGCDVSDLAVRVSDRHFGIGSDGLIAVAPSETADARMIMFNADGSEGAMCGNGIRCVAKFVYDKGITTGDATMRIETASGMRDLTLTIDKGESHNTLSTSSPESSNVDGVCTYVLVNMGQAILSPAEIPVDATKFGGKAGSSANRMSGIGRVRKALGKPNDVPDDAIISKPLEVNGKTYEVTCVSMGNPHCVIFTEGIDDLDLPVIGPYFEKHVAFPNQINTEFVEVIDEHTLRMRVWERGSGETMACGTGSCAVTVAAVLNGHVKRGDEIEVQLRGGELYDTWTDSGEVMMKGPAEVAFTGDYNG